MSEFDDDEARELGTAWFKSLGVRFHDVWFLINHEWQCRQQVADVETFDECVRADWGRTAARYVVFERDGVWVLWTRGKPERRYPSREAAEMVAMHNG